MRPAVSAVNGSAPALDVVADQSRGSLSLAASYTASTLLGADFGMPAANDTDRYVFESGILSSPNSDSFEDDYLTGDATALASTDSFDLSHYLHDDGNGDVSASQNARGLPADIEFSNHFTDFETHFSSENINLQPHSGASAYGCDDGVIAVGAV